MDDLQCFPGCQTLRLQLSLSRAHHSHPTNTDRLLTCALVGSDANDFLTDGAARSVDFGDSVTHRAVVEDGECTLTWIGPDSETGLLKWADGDEDAEDVAPWG